MKKETKIIIVSLTIAFVAFCVIGGLVLKNVLNNQEFYLWYYYTVPDLTTDMKMIANSLKSKDYETAKTWAEQLEKDCERFLDEIDTYHPTDTAKYVQEEIKEALYDYKMAAFYIKKGIQYDESYLFKAIDYLDSGTRHIEKTNSIMENS